MKGIRLVTDSENHNTEYPGFAKDWVLLQQIGVHELFGFTLEQLHHSPSSPPTSPSHLPQGEKSSDGANGTQEGGTTAGSNGTAHSSSSHPPPRDRVMERLEKLSEMTELLQSSISGK